MTTNQATALAAQRTAPEAATRCRGESVPAARRVPGGARGRRADQSLTESQGAAAVPGRVAAGLRISEALTVEAGDLSLDTERPTIRVRQGQDRAGSC